MKVLLTLPLADKATGQHILESLKEAKCDVAAVDPRVNPEQILPVFYKFRPDFVFCSKLANFTEKAIEMRKYVPVVCWNVDVKERVKDWGTDLLSLFSNVDILYTVSPTLANEFNKIYPGTMAKSLLQGCHPPVHGRQPLTQADWDKYKCDVMFAGDVHNYEHAGRREVLSYLRSNGVNVRHYWGPTGIYNEEHAKACQCSKIVLGMSAFPHLRHSISVRDFKVMAAGNLLLTRYCAGMQDIFELGKMCVAWETKEECLEKVEYYLANKEERKAIGDYGHDQILLRHTYFHRVKKIIQDVKEFVKRK